jgi:dihydroneopterin aldolase
VSKDRIALRGIRAYGRHGADAGERVAAQPLDLDVEVELDLARARARDALGETLDYAELHEQIVAIVRDRSFALLERLADEISAAVLADSRVDAVTVTIAKPELLSGATPSVTVRAERPGVP